MAGYPYVQPDVPLKFCLAVCRHSVITVPGSGIKYPAEITGCSTKVPAEEQYSGGKRSRYRGSDWVASPKPAILTEGAGISRETDIHRYKWIAGTDCELLIAR